MKQIYTLLLLLFVITFSQAQIVNIPDANFKNALVNNSVADFDGDGSADGDVDTNNDGEIQVSEAEAALGLSVDNLNISSLVGVEFFINITTLGCQFNNLTSLDVSQNTKLSSLSCGWNSLTSIDVTNNPDLTWLTCNSNQLISAFIKNGTVIPISPNFDFSNNPNLEYMCVDEEELVAVQTEMNNFGYTCEVNSYCSYTPGGKYYSVEGSIKYDIDNDGCDSGDLAYNNPRILLQENGVTTGIYFGNENGEYNIPVGDGLHTIIPELEFPAYFTLSPSNVIVNFPTDASPFGQDFCISQNGNYNDLEIIILPLELARPGFDTNYKLVYKNKGTTVMSGTVGLDFNDNLMNQVSANPAVDNQAVGNLTWDYTNLQPFETRTIEFTMNINTPTDPTYPVNGGDVLSFVSRIYPIVGDEVSRDNLASLKQTVVNSYDPNDKTCIEGATIEPSMVGEYLHYLIRFENTGSASAINIVVKDIIDTSKYDINSLRPIDGSHSFVTRIRDTNIVEFIFENINLPHDDANNDGYVAFKIKSLPSLVLGDTLDNNAEIYFDYNFPIITNVAQTTVAVLGIGDYTLDSSLQMYPNPVKENLSVSGNNNLKSIAIYDVNGRLLQEVSFIGNQLERTISLSELETGIYVVKIVSSKGQLVKQLMKE